MTDHETILALQAENSRLKAAVQAVRGELALHSEFAQASMESGVWPDSVLSGITMLRAAIRKMDTILEPEDV